MVQVVGLERIEAMGSVQDVISSVEVSDVNLSIGDESGVKMRRAKYRGTKRPVRHGNVQGKLVVAQGDKDCVKVVPEENLFGVEQGKGFWRIKFQNSSNSN